MSYDFVGTIAQVDDYTANTLTAYGSPRYVFNNGNMYYYYGTHVAGLQYVYLNRDASSEYLTIVAISDTSFDLGALIKNSDNPQSVHYYNSYPPYSYYPGTHVFMGQGPLKSSVPAGTRMYNSWEELFPGLPIIYRDTNCSHNGPDLGIPGNVVTVNYTFPEGYGIANPSADVYVTNNGVAIPSQYSNGVLTFTMPTQP